MRDGERTRCSAGTAETIWVKIRDNEGGNVILNCRSRPSGQLDSKLGAVCGAERPPQDCRSPGDRAVRWRPAHPRDSSVSKGGLSSGPGPGSPDYHAVRSRTETVPAGAAPLVAELPQAERDPRPPPQTQPAVRAPALPVSRRSGLQTHEWPSFRGRCRGLLPLDPQEEGSFQWAPRDPW